MIDYTRKVQLKKYLRILLIVTLMINISLRFINIDRKVFWYNEVYTSFRVAGYTDKKITQDFREEFRIYSNKNLQKYQHPNSSQTIAQGISNTVQSLSAEDSQHAPLYYIISRLWVEIFGESITSLRIVSAIASLLIFPSAYWLCSELFNSPTVGLTAVNLLAVSPFFTLYAQEAREYSLLSVITLASSAAFLKAIRKETQLKINWIIYFSTLVLGLYTYPLFGLTLISHTLYIFFSSDTRSIKKINLYLISVFSAICIYWPWLYKIFEGFFGRENRTLAFASAGSNSSFGVLRIFLGHARRLFLDFDVYETGIAKILSTLMFFLVISLTIFAILHLYQKFSKNSALFILSMMVVPVISLLLPDLIFGGMRTYSARYSIQFLLMIELSVAYIVAQLALLGLSDKYRSLGKILLVFLSASGLVSCILMLSANTWWSKYSDREIPRIAAVINQLEKPLLVSDASMPEVIALSYSLVPSVNFLIYPSSCRTCVASLPSQHYVNSFARILTYQSACKTLILYRPSTQLKLALKKDFLLLRLPNTKIVSGFYVLKKQKRFIRKL